MDDIQKSRVRLAHWVEHNVEHLKGYGEVAAVLEKEGLPSVAGKVREGIHLIEAANREFQNALEELSGLGGQAAKMDQAVHTHSHTHEEGHEHSHEHGHGHGHQHQHADEE